MHALTKLNAIVVLFGLFGAGMAACSTVGAAPTDGDDEPGLAPESLGGCSQCGNCVKYARCRQPALPYGLFSYQDKLNIIKSHSPTPGAVAIIDVGNSVGHVAYVESVNEDEITISEGNWPYGRCGQRTGTPGQLHVQGYFVP